MNLSTVLSSEAALPPDVLAAVGWTVLIASVLITLAWLAYLYR